MCTMQFAMFIENAAPPKKVLTKTFSDQDLKSWRKMYISTEWPQQVGDCWHCCHSFKGLPYPLPTNYDEKRNLFTLRGCFCSWGCVKGYNNETGGSRSFEISATIAFLMKRVYGHTTRCRAAPTRTLLAKFGGHMSVEDFRAQTNNFALTRLMLPNVFNKDTPISSYILNDCTQLKDREKEAARKKILESEAIPDEPLRIKRRGTEKKKHTNTLSRLMITSDT